MRPYVLLQHRWLLAANAALLTNIFASSTTPYIRVLLIALKTNYVGWRDCCCRCRYRIVAAWRLLIFDSNLLNLIVCGRNSHCELNGLHINQLHKILLVLSDCKFAGSLSRIVQTHGCIWREVQYVWVVSIINLPVTVHRQLVLILNVRWLWLIDRAVKGFRARFQSQICVGVTVEIELHTRL